MSWAPQQTRPSLFCLHPHSTSRGEIFLPILQIRKLRLKEAQELAPVPGQVLGGIEPVVPHAAPRPQEFLWPQPKPSTAFWVKIFLAFVLRVCDGPDKLSPESKAKVP